MLVAVIGFAGLVAAALIPVLVDSCHHPKPTPPPSATSTPASLTATAHARVSTRVRVGGAFNVEAGGCQNVAVPKEATAPGDVDTSKGGGGSAPSGWDIEPAGNGSHSIRDVTANGRRLTFTLQAEGGGTSALGACVNPTGANSAANIYAYVFSD